VVSFVVIVLHILVYSLSKGAFSEEDHPAKALLFQAFYEALGKAVLLGRGRELPPSLY